MADLMKWFDTRRSPVEMIERLFEGDTAASGIRVEEAVEGNTLVVRAELPGIDPEKDVNVSIVDGALEIKAERREQSEQKGKDSYRSEFRYGSFVRRVALPDGVKPDDITASYKDGVLEVRTPVPAKSQEAPARKIEITRG
ncbi:Hsp20/alpha crystallin family protein [Pseudarthrobacter sp. H3Y2-7]|jgi:HSP20 family protein|uniref:Hsp20/alpha crystallin family protein n=1 Tax=Pseudarthrobacter TaxID=1742993 RepID=UPI0023AFF28E|nr:MULTISPECIES: Hsp20/alpha crystallin family protein [unclassified Pseudarthrobacter]MDE8668826.1 Hsp20/alpha crystallin family protein [Pseudarthrobacter sp. H3Y2-7]